MSCSSHAHGLAYQRVSCRFFITLFLLPWASTPIIPPVSGGRTLRITSSIAAAMGTFWHKFQKSVPYYIIYTGTMELFTFDNFFLNLYLVLHAGMHVMHYKVFWVFFLFVPGTSCGHARHALHSAWWRFPPVYIYIHIHLYLQHIWNMYVREYIHIFIYAACTCYI